jgi:hypothetical protein
MAGARHKVRAATDEAFTGIYDHHRNDDVPRDCSDDSDVYGGVLDATQELALSTVGEDRVYPRYTDLRALRWGAYDGTSCF